MLRSISIEPPRTRETAADALPRDAVSHFKLWFHAAVLHIARRISEDEAVEFPFIQSYLDELRELGGFASAADLSSADWFARIERWETGASAWLPLRTLAQSAALDPAAISLLLCIGLMEEDSRFGALFEWAQPGSAGQQRPTMALLTAWWRDDEDCSTVRDNLRKLRELGLIEIVNPEAPRIHWGFQPTAMLWDILRGETRVPAFSWLRFEPVGMLPRIDALILPPDLDRIAHAVPALLKSGEARAIVVRGASHNGRKTLLRSFARELGLGVLEVSGAVKPDEERWNWLGTMATLLRAMPIFSFELGAADGAAVPVLAGYLGPLGIAAGRHGVLGGAVVESAITLEVPMPDPAARRLLWAKALQSPEQAPRWVERFHLTSGGIFRSARIARSHALLDGRDTIQENDVRHANQALQQPLEALAVRLSTSGGWAQMAGASDTTAELRALENRCRHREELLRAVGPAMGGSLNRGVRALFSGPSGTGKTLAARLLASELRMDIYRLDLSAVVNKYIGETEKNLNQLFSRAEELDVILLLDEGDALLTSRTAVQSSNDRYANLETNFLLQRIESFEGILVVTSNAAARIDFAFQRRMDVVVEFRPPEAEERWNIWQLHLPPHHTVDAGWLQNTVLRCNLTGGQIRNAVLHASMLALDGNGAVGTLHADVAVRREYRKMGAVCPLRPATTALTR